MVNSRSDGVYGNTEGKEISEYEQSREKRIKENRERMQKLGILDLSLQFKAHKPSTTSRSRKQPPSSRSTPLNPSPLPCPEPVRRSSRLQNVTPVSYSEALFTKNDKSLSSEVDLLRLREEGAKPEFYTEEQEKLLGSTEMEWTLFIDGVGRDGKRIYDPVKGKTCHQCRQKTLGLRTHCSKCNMVQGQFCGDCLYMRYGENVIEANQNPNWICPVCREICNCSLCRQAKGWPPTGVLYRKVTSLGYKSVAHFLIQTRRLKPETETDSNSKVPVSVKRSLAFAFPEETSTENVGTLSCDKQDEKTYFSDGGNDKRRKQLFLDNEQGQEQGDGGESKPDFKQEEKTTLLVQEQGDGMTEEEKTQLFLDTEQGQLDTVMMKLDCDNVPGEDNGFGWKAGLSISSQDQNGTFAIDKINCEFSDKNPDKTSSNIDIDNSKIDCTLAPESSPVSKKKHVRTIEATGDSIAGRLRLRRNSTENPNSSSQTTVSDNISKRLRKRCNENQVQETNKSSSSSAKAETTDILSPVTAANTSSKSKRKPTCSSEPPPCLDDSIAGRLRQRRVQTKDV